MHTSTLASSLVALAFACAANGQATWTQVPGNAPANRYWHAMAYDSHAGGIVLFGGYFGPAPPSAAQDTWTRFGGTWAAVATPLVPSTVYLHAMAYDSARQRTVLFGGVWFPTSSGTWEFDSSTLAWTAVAPASSPPARIRHAMVFDSARSCVVLFGGTTGPALSDTWEFDGVTWTSRVPATSPPARFGHAMAYDSARQRTVLFGGATNTNVLGDTWEWDGSSWAPKFTPSFPSARRETAMAFDAARNRIVLFGGTNGVGHFGDTWEFDGVTWTSFTPTQSPTPRSAHAMVYDQSLQRIVLFGGNTGQAVGGTWTLGPAPSIATASAYGSGCGLTALGLLRRERAPGHRPASQRNHRRCANPRRCNVHRMEQHCLRPLRLAGDACRHRDARLRTAAVIRRDEPRSHSADFDNPPLHPATAELAEPLGCPGVLASVCIRPWREPARGRRQQRRRLDDRRHVTTQVAAHPSTSRHGIDCPARIGTSVLSPNGSSAGTVHDSFASVMRSGLRGRR